jgi:ATP-dependent Clp protease ATP-binding subunit ClpC
VTRGLNLRIDLEMSRPQSPSGSNLFERFDESAKRVMVEAQDQARLLKHNYLGTEHLLLAVVNEPKARDILETRSRTLEEVRAMVDDIIGPGSTPPVGPPPFTPRAKRVIELAFRESLERRDDNVSSEHILLGLLREGEGVAAQVMNKLGLSEEEIRRAIES